MSFCISCVDQLTAYISSYMASVCSDCDKLLTFDSSHHKIPFSVLHCSLIVTLWYAWIELCSHYVEIIIVIQNITKLDSMR